MLMFPKHSQNYSVNGNVGIKGLKHDRFLLISGTERWMIDEGQTVFLTKYFPKGGKKQAKQISVM